MTKKKEEEDRELTFGQPLNQSYEDYRSFKDTGITYESFEDKSPKKAEPKKRPGSNMIRTKKGTLARRGSISARQAENRERNKKRAQEAAKKRQQAKNK